ncbi:MAG: 50S ribosomal protein L32 [Alphaproteobacteria bacterium]|nr:50S ribosomal protein L32 [Alphaproteobacteria bacterium]NCB50054.1 50S ribosomal protein L32 [Alphaproteobacteria bacterium]
MAVPKSKTSKSCKGMRRSHDAVSTSAFVECPNCGEMKRPHHICESCGYYRKKEVISKASEEK